MAAAFTVSWISSRSRSYFAGELGPDKHAMHRRLLRPRPSASDSRAKYMASALAPAKQMSETLGWNLEILVKVVKKPDSKVFVGDTVGHAWLLRRSFLACDMFIEPFPLLVSMSIYCIKPRIHYLNGFLLLPFAFPQWTKGDGL